MPANTNVCRPPTGHPAALPTGLQSARWPLLAAKLGLLSGLLGAAAATATTADEPTGCSLLWQVHITAPGDGAARQLLVHMAFDAGPRSRTVLRLPGGWAGLADSSGPAGASGAITSTQAVPDAPLLRTVAHAPGERVRLRWRYSGPTDAAQGGSVRLAPGWFALAGLGVLPMPDEIDERNPPSACIQLHLHGHDGSAASPTRWASSHGQADGPTALFRLPASNIPAPNSPPPSASLRQRVQQALYAGGALDRFQPPADGLPLTLVRPSATAWLAPIGSLGQAAVQTWAAQRQFWGDNSSAAPLLLLLLPGDSPATGGNWHQALAVQAPADLAWPGAAADALLTGALLSTWVPDRFGPLVHAGRNDAALRAWFSDGLAAHYSHRLLLRTGRMTADTYAQVMNQGITRLAGVAATAASQATAATAQPDTSTSLAALRGEWLALQWHNALRAAGQPGLDAVLQRLLLAPALARHEGPISAPLATHRLVAALRPVLGDAPLRDIQRQAERGEPAPLGPTSLGPCFTGAAMAAAGGTAAALMQYQPVPQALQQVDCQGWLGLGPQAVAAQTSSRLRSATRPVEPDATPAPRRAGKAGGLKKSKNLQGRSGKAGSKTKVGTGRAKATSGKPARTKIGSKQAGSKQAGTKQAGKR